MRPRCSTLLLLLLAAISAGPAVHADELDGLVQRLNHDEFDLRESAMKRLILIGTPAVDALRAAAVKGPAEVTWRAMHAITEIAVAGDLSQRNLAEEALDGLKKSANPSVASRAASALAELPETRQSRAIAMIQSLGGRIDLSGTQLTLNEDWTGGETGLAYIRHVAALRHVRVEPSAPIDDATLKKLTDTLGARDPAVKVTAFGHAFMGVAAAAEDGSSGMVVSIEPAADSPAGKAGIKAYDVITAIDKTPINNFDDLVGVMRKRKPGDVVAVQLSRTDPETGDPKAIEVKVSLGERPRNLAQ